MNLNPTLKTKLNISDDSDFSIHNIPFGIYSDSNVKHHVCSAIGEYIIDLFELESADVFDLNREVFTKEFLNEFIELGKPITNKVRAKIQELLSADNSVLIKDEKLFHSVFKKQNAVKMLMPVKVGDYTDFYSSIEHATNVGTMFRDPNNALLPNWKHLPIGYHGRASSIIVSGTPIHRPKGQTKPNADAPPVFGPCKLLDFELEMAFITFNGKPLGQHITTQEADEYIFGMVIFNDWSARDIQTWEYVPLGPFLSKNFASSVSTWVVTTEALEPFRVEGPEQNPTPLPYLQ